MEREEKKYRELIGKIGDEYYFLDDIFKYADNFRGATGSVMRPVSSNEYNQRLNAYDEDGELWRGAVQAGNTEMGMNEWHDYVINMDGDDAIFDLSYRDYADALYEKGIVNESDYPIIECVGGGRCFDTIGAHGEKFEVVYNQELLDKIFEAEKTA